MPILSLIIVGACALSAFAGWCCQAAWSEHRRSKAFDADLAELLAELAPPRSGGHVRLLDAGGDA